ncbi:hypothetical protein TcCL_NonESM07352 [Trypanosoma cruzi]|nr:hypothetical protein TcCL_NonESM07352 [Trypanosoma cruzi]
MLSCSIGANTGAAGSKGRSRLFPPAVPMALGGALAWRGGRCAMRPHCNACRQNSQGPPPPQQHNVQLATTPPHYCPFLFCFIHFVRLFASSLTLKISAPSQKNKKEARSHRPAAGQHSRPPTAIAAQETAVTSQSQHHNAHRTTVQ